MKTNTWFCNTSGFNMRKNVKKIAWEVCKSASSGVRRGRGGEQRPPWSSLGRRAPAPGGGWAAGRGRQVGGVVWIQGDTGGVVGVSNMPSVVSTIASTVVSKLLFTDLSFWCQLVPLDR